MRPFWKTALIALVAGAGVLGSVAAYRVYRSATIGAALISNLRYQLESGEMLDTIPGEQAISSDYLKIIFGDNPSLLRELQRILQQGTRNSDQLMLDEVSAILVTYRQAEADEPVADVCAHFFGSYKVARRAPGFHRDGYFKHLVDQSLWELGNTSIGLLGRDLVFYADPEVEEMQRRLMDSMLTGDIDPILHAIEKPYHYILVLPTPRKLLPAQLRSMIRTLIVRGNMTQYTGATEMVLLCGEDRDADYASSIFHDLKLGAEMTLRTRFGGYVSEREWGPYVECWWAYEMAQTLRRYKFRPTGNLVQLNLKYGRVMNNVLLKSIERMGRDLFQITSSLDLKKDPRAVDAEMQNAHGSHYWSAKHKWGPNWPIMPPKESRMDHANNGIVPTEQTGVEAAPEPSLREN